MTEPALADAPVPTASRAVLAQVERAIRDFDLIRPGDRVAVGISGGKDSLLLAVTLRELARRRDRPFELGFVHLDQHQPGFARAQFDAVTARLGLEVEVVSADTWSVVEAELRPGQIPCALCGKLRRGVLNRWCAERGYTRLALGHHLDDALETFLLNLLFQRRLERMAPARAAERVPVTVIRPLILVEERKIRAWVAQHGLEPVPCPVCDKTPESSRRDLEQVLVTLRGIRPDLDEALRDALYGAARPEGLADGLALVDG